MDAGVAALLGAVVGGLLGAGGTLGAAALTGRAQGVSQHAQWRREGRRAAYSAFIAAVTAHQQAANELMLLMDADVIDTTRVHSVLASVKELEAAVSASAPVVIVEGPAQVGQLAGRLAHQSLELTVSQTLFVEDPAALLGPMNPYANSANDHIVNIARGLTAFAEQARTALDALAHVT